MASKVRPEDLPHYPEANPLFVFCHGGLGCGTNVWFPYAHVTVADHNCDFISPDCPNPETPRYEAYKEVLVDRINKKWNKKQPIILVGHALGAYIFFRMLIECQDEEWSKNVKGFFIISPVTSMNLCSPEQRALLPGFTEINFQKIVKLPIKFRHIYNVNDIVLGTKSSEFLQKVMTDAGSDYKVTPLNTDKYDSHFGGFLHYSVKEINDGLVSLLHEIDPSI